MSFLKAWPWRESAFQSLARYPAVCDLKSVEVMWRVLETARALGVMPSDVLTVADHMARNPHTGEICLYSKVIPRPADNDPCRCHNTAEESLTNTPLELEPKPLRPHRSTTTARGARQHASRAPKSSRVATQPKAKTHRRKAERDRS